MLSRVAKRSALICEVVSGKSYEYVPLGRFVVSAPRVCRGRPTFKYTRVEVAGVLEWLGAGNSLEVLVENLGGRVSRPAIREAARLAAKALAKQASQVEAVN